jgi:heme-degrading monooxygenase HmoA
MMRSNSVRILSACLLLTACTSTATTADAAVDALPPDGASSACSRGVLEADAELAPFVGPGADAESGALLPFDGSRIVSSTYLRIAPGAEQRFGELVGTIQGSLGTTPGLVAISFERSADCGSARTLVVWENAGAMYDFVSSPAHVAAMNEAPDVAAAGSAVVHWSTSDASEVSWAAATARIGLAPPIDP